MEPDLKLVDLLPYHVAVEHLHRLSPLIEPVRIARSVYRLAVPHRRHPNWLGLQRRVSA